MKKKPWINKPTLQKLQSDMTQSMSNHNEHIRKLSVYKSILDDDLYGQMTRKDKSDYRSKRFAKISNNIVAKVEQSILSVSKLFQLEESSSDSIDKVEMNEDIINYQFNYLLNKRYIVGRAAKKLVEQGTVIAKVGWLINVEQIKKQVQEPIMSTDVGEINQAISRLAKNDPAKAEQLVSMANSGQPVPVGFSSKEVTVNKVHKNQPTITILDSESVIIDPLSNGDISKAMFAIEMVKTNIAELKSSSIKYFNLDKLKVEGTGPYTGEVYDGLESTMDSQYNIDRNVNFNYSDDARKRLTMYEYWGYWDVYGNGKLVGFVASWIGNTLIRLEENPYSHGKLPYSLANYNLSSTGDVWGDSLCELMYQEQRGETNAVRAMQDITNDASVGQEFVDRTIFENTIQEDNYKAGRTVYVRKGSTPENSIFRKTTNPIPTVLFDLKEVYMTDIQQTVGFIGVDDKKTSPNVTGSPTAHLIDTDVEDSVLGRFGGLFEDCARLILSMNKDYLLNNNSFKDSNGERQEINVSMISADMHVTTNIMSIEKRNTMANSIMELMRTNAANMTPEIASLHYVEFANLYNLTRLENAVKKASEPQPPSPQEEELQRLELENAQLLNEKLKSEIQFDQGRARDAASKAEERTARIQNGFIQAEVQKEQASAQLDTAQATKLAKQSALFDQEFDLVDSGIKREEQKEDHEYQHAANLQREKVRTDREAQQIEQKRVSDKDEVETEDSIDGEEDSTQELIDYIGEGTILNNSFDPADAVYRNIADVNRTDTEQYKQPIRDAEAIQSAARNEIRDGLSFTNDAN